MKQQTFNEIQASILDAKATAGELNALEVLTTSEQTINDADSTSKVAIWRLWVWVFSFIIWTHQKVMFALAAATRHNNSTSFREDILNFHDGLKLVWKNKQFQYDFTGISNPDERKIIKNCAIVENNSGRTVVKISGENNQPVTTIQQNRVFEYIKEIKPPGAEIVLINIAPDLLKLTVTAYIDTTIIDIATGRLLSTADEVYPVKEAIYNYLKALEFNGTFVKDHLRSTAKEKEGVKLLSIDLLQRKYATFPFINCDEWVMSQSGSFSLLEENLTINYENYAMVNN